MAEPVTSDSNNSLSQSSKTQWYSLKRNSITQIEIFLFAMTVVVGGQFMPSLSEGFDTIITAFTLIGVGYILLAFCLAEMTSTLPFSGGIYGFVRAFTIPLYGFYIACFEIILNIFYIALQVQLIAALASNNGNNGGGVSSTLFICLESYLILLAIILVEGKLFWMINNVMGVYCVVFLLIFILGSFNFFNEENLQKAHEIKPLHGLTVFQTLADANLMFCGIQFISLTSRYAKNPKKDIPIVTGLVIVIVFFTGAGVLITSCGSQLSLALGQNANYPLNYGFQKIFKISSTSSTRWLAYPGIFANCYGFIFSTGRQAHTMAKSGLLPSIFLKTLPFFDTPYRALLGCCSLAFVVNIFLTISPASFHVMVDITALSCFIVFIGAFIAFLRFQKKYSTLERYFSSPFGVPGAWIGLIVFSLGLIFTVVNPRGGHISVGVVGGITLILLFYFYFLGSKYHVFSDEEKEALFKAYLVNANVATKKRLRLLKHNKVVPATTTEDKTTTENKSAPVVSTALDTTSPLPLESEVRPAFIQGNLGDIEAADLAKENQILAPEVTASAKFSQKIAHYMSVKLNQVLPKQDLLSNELVILQQGGEFCQQGKDFTSEEEGETVV